MTPGPGFTCRACNDRYLVDQNEHIGRLHLERADLLEALKEIVARCQAEDVPWAEELNARAVIAKARGEA